MNEVVREKLFYTYGVTENKDPGLALKGIDEKGLVFLLPYREIAGLVSEVPSAEFDETLLQENLGKLNWIQPKIWAHEKVLEEVLKIQPAVPMKFCTLFKTKERVQKVLEEHYERFKELLIHLKDKEEWGVKVFCDLERLEQFIQMENPDVRNLDEGLSQKPSGTAYLLGKRKEKLLSQKVDEEMTRLAQRYFEELQKATEGSRLSPLSSKELTGKKNEMILNASFLIDRKKVPEFTQFVSQLKVTLQAKKLGLEFEQVGPFPPYNFSEIREEVPS